MAVPRTTSINYSLLRRGQTCAMSSSSKRTSCLVLPSRILLMLTNSRLLPGRTVQTTYALAGGRYCSLPICRARGGTMPPRWMGGRASEPRLIPTTIPFGLPRGWRRLSIRFSMACMSIALTMRNIPNLGSNNHAGPTRCAPLRLKATCHSVVCTSPIRPRLALTIRAQ